MESKVNYLLVGLFVLALAAALIVGVLWLSVGGFYQSYDRYLVVTRESVAGLNIDAQVTFNGVPVGRVARIALEPDDPEQVRLLLEVAAGTPVKRDTQAMLRMQGLTGLLTVDLVGSSRAAPPLQRAPGEAYPVIESKPSLMTNLEENVSSLLLELRETALRFNQLLDAGNRGNIGRILAHLEQTTAGLAAQREPLEQALRDLAAAMRDARQASGQLPALVQELRGAAEALDRMAGRIAGAGTQLAQDATASAADVRRFTRDALPQAAALVDELYQAARSFRELGDQLAREPASLIYGAPQPAPGPGE